MAPQNVKAYIKRKAQQTTGAMRKGYDGDEPPDDAIRAGENRRAAGRPDAGGGSSGRSSWLMRVKAYPDCVMYTIRGYAAEFGLITAKGLDKIEPLLARIAQDNTAPAMARELLAFQGRDYARLQTELKAIEARLMAWHRANADSCRLAQIPGVGPIGATALVMKAPDPRLFPSGRHFAAWIGLTPKDHSTAGKTRLGKITRAGDEMLRSVLVAGATAVIKQAKHGRGSPWLLALLKRKAPKHAAVALANKIARIAWKLMVTGESYDGARMHSASALRLQRSAGRRSS